MGVARQPLILPPARNGHSVRSRYAQVGGRVPIERVDLLDRLKVFADVHRTTRFGMDGAVQPIIDITPLQEQVPTFVSSLTQLNGGAGTNTAIALGAGAFATRIARLVTVKVRSPVVGAIQFFTASHQYLAGAAAAVQNMFLDGRRGTGTTALGTTAFLLQSSSAAGNAQPTNGGFFELFIDTINKDFFFPDSMLKAVVANPTTDLVFRHSVAVADLSATVVWSEEPNQVTRTVVA